MEVITHQAIGMDSMIESFNAFLEQQEKLASIHVFKKYIISAITPKDYVIKSAWIMDSRFTCHGL
jgi:hypothetical protein